MSLGWWEFWGQYGLFLRVTALFDLASLLSRLLQGGFAILKHTALPSLGQGRTLAVSWWQGDLLAAVEGLESWGSSSAQCSWVHVGIRNQTLRWK